MCSKPKVSVLLPTHNSMLYLSQAIESVLKQNYQDFEFLIIDDHSIDETSKLLAYYSQRDARIRIFRNEDNMGVARSLNRAIEVAEGEYIARMDSDDISLPERFQKQITFLDAHPAVGVLGTQTLFIEEDGQLSEQAQWEKPRSHNRLIWHLLYSTPFCHPSIMMRTECLHSAGGYNPAYQNEDMQLWTRMAFLTRLANLDETLLLYRLPYESHIRKLASYEPLVQRVSCEYIERLVHHSIDPKLVRIFFHFQKYGSYLEKGLALPDIFQVCTMLEEVFQAMQASQLFELDDIETVGSLLFHQVQGLISAAF